MSTSALLPRAAWTQRASLAKLVEALGAQNVRWVGGCVRDTLLGHEANDIDAATRHLGSFAGPLNTLNSTCCS